jgi:hypothetical protein
VTRFDLARRGFILTIAAIAVLGVFAAVASADGHHSDNFSLFGAARLVTGGIVPHDVAADLTSNCGSVPITNTPPAEVCDPSQVAFVFSGVAFTPDKKHTLTLSQITTLSTDYNMNGTDCSGGSPRFVILTATHNYVVNIGKPPFGGNCYYGWQNTGNITSTTDPTLRWQIDLANTFVSWSDVLAGHGTEQVTEVDIVLDGGWIALRGQDVTIDNYTVNNEVSRFGRGD